MNGRHFYQNSLFRNSDVEDEEVQETCVNGYVKRHGQFARRERDCSYDCSKGEHCEELARKAFWKGQKWKSSQ